MKSGTLYVVFNKWISDPKNGETPYKIGITQHTVEHRYSGLGLQMPGAFETLFAYEIKNYKKAETSIQTILSKKCVRGEWFKLDPKEIDFIKESCEMMDGILITEEVKDEIKKETGCGASDGSYDSPNNDADGEHMPKTEAIRILNKKLSLDLDSKNTVYSNINKNELIWWLDISNAKFNEDLNMLLNDRNKRIIYHFLLKAGTIKKPKNKFRQRDDARRQDTSTIKINVADNNFVDKWRGFQFSKYLKNKVDY